MVSFTNSFTARIFDKTSIFSNSIFDIDTRILEPSLQKIVNRDEIQELKIPVPYVNHAFHHLNDQIFITFPDKSQNKQLAHAFNYEADETNTNKLGLKFLSLALSGPMFPKPPSLNLPYLSPVLEFSTRFDKNKEDINSMPYTLPKKVQIRIRIPLLLTPVDTNQFKPKCVVIKQLKTKPENFKVKSFHDNSKLITDKRTGKIMVECRIEINIWTPGNMSSFYNWIAVIGQDDRKVGGGKEKEWERRTDLSGGGKSGNTWVFREYNVKSLIGKKAYIIEVMFSSMCIIMFLFNWLA